MASDVKVELEYAERKLASLAEELDNTKQWTEIDYYKFPSWKSWYGPTVIANKEVIHDIKAYWSKTKQMFRAFVIFGGVSLGSPFHTHGGLTYSLMDSFAGRTFAYCTKKPGLTKSGNIQYKAPIFPFRVYILETHLLSCDEKGGTLEVDILEDKGLCMKGIFDFRFGQKVLKWDMKTQTGAKL